MNLLHHRLTLAGVGVLAIGGLGASLVTVLGGTAAAGPGRAGEFSRLATYPVFQNVPSGVDPADGTVAEISAVSGDGKTLAYTDAVGGRIGFLDITDPSAPEGLGNHDVSGGKGGSPTSVSIVGDYALVVVDESTYPGLEDTAWEDEEPAVGTRAGRIDVISLSSPHEEVATYDLGGQPDSIAVSPDETYAAIAMENQRNEAVTPAGGEEGDLPQTPAGSVKVVSLDGGPADWGITDVALPAKALKGLDTPEDAEPEYVDISSENKLALTLQENNGVAIIDLAKASVETAWSAGNAVVSGVDTTDDGLFNATETIDAPREPDAIQWVGDGLVATANEGDWKGGTRGWTVFSSATGKVVWDAGSSFEDLATKHGLHNNDRAAKKGAEPEGIAFDIFGGVPYAFVGSERSNFVAVYDMRTPSAPKFKQVLPATNGPEGLLPIPSRNLLAISSEEDSAEDLVRASVSLYGFGKVGRKGASILTVESADEDGKPIGWGALGALSQVPGERGKLYAASDAAYATGRIYTLSTRPTGHARGPGAVIDDVLEVTDESGAPAEGLDIEGLAARRGGGFWVADEGATGSENSLLRVTRGGQVAETVTLPAEIASKVGKWGLEGVTVTGTGDEEKVYVALQRPLWADSTAKKPGVDGASTARIGRYTPATGTWEWFGYGLEKTSVDGDWMGLSEITAVDDDDTLAVIERDKQNGTTAAIKRVYSVDVSGAGTKGLAPVEPLAKTLAVDVLPALRSTHGWTQEKLEGLTIGADRRVYAVTDNDGLSDATGETVLLDLGRAGKVFGRR